MAYLKQYSWIFYTLQSVSEVLADLDHFMNDQTFQNVDKT